MIFTDKLNIHTVLRFTACMIILCGLVFVPVKAAEASELSGGGGAAVIGSIDGIGYSARLYNAENGLPTSDANIVFSSSDGFILIGGNSGLIRYDGTSFERQSSVGGITGVNTIFEDSKGRLWIGSGDNGITCLNKGESMHFSYNEGLLSSSVHAICEDGYGNILIGTTHGIYLIDADLNLNFLNDGRTSGEYIVNLCADGSGTVYGNTKEGSVFRIRDLQVTDYYSPYDLACGFIASLSPGPENSGAVWLGNSNGILCRGSFDDGFADLEYFYLSYYSDVTDETGTTLIPETEPIKHIGYMAGTVWVTTDRRIFYLNSEKDFVRLENIPMNNAINSMAEDFEGNLWFSSSSQGVMKIVANKFLDVTDRAECSLSEQIPDLK